jgi:hypothetical protein
MSIMSTHKEQIEIDVPDGHRISCMRVESLPNDSADMTLQIEFEKVHKEPELVYEMGDLGRWTLADVWSSENIANRIGRGWVEVDGEKLTPVELSYSKDKWIGLARWNDGINIRPKPWQLLRAHKPEQTYYNGRCDKCNKIIPQCTCRPKKSFDGNKGCDTCEQVAIPPNLRPMCWNCHAPDFRHYSPKQPLASPLQPIEKIRNWDSAHRIETRMEMLFSQIIEIIESHNALLSRVAELEETK